LYCYIHCRTIVVHIMSYKKMVEILIVSNQFRTSGKLIDYLFGENASVNLQDGNDAFKYIELNKDGSSVKIKDADPNQENSILRLLINSEITEKENEMLRQKIKALEQRPTINRAVNEKLKKQILKKRKKGKSYESIAFELNEKGLKNSFNRPLSGQQVRRLYNTAIKEI